MCLIFLSLNVHPTYKLIVAGNRDEFYDRKTAPASFWQDYPHVLGGRDLEAGGTWMGVTRSGKISFVTNYRDPQHINPQAPSRGMLVSDYLEGNVAPDVYMQGVASKAKQYNGFNLVAGNADALYYLSNYGKGVEKIPKGFHGLSNHLLETPWPKVIRGKERLADILAGKKINTDHLMDALYDDQLAPDDQLPDTGIGLERERVLSSMFIKSPGYGSRCSTVLLIDQSNTLTFSERSYDITSFEYTTKTFQFTIQ